MALFSRKVCTAAGIFLALISGFSNKLLSQTAVGLDVGYVKNYLITNNANRAFTDYRPRIGFSVGIPVHFQLTDWFSVVAEPTFIQKNYRQERSGFFSPIFQNTTNNYIDIPLMAHFMFGGERLKGFFNAGIYAGYWISSRIEGVGINILDVPAGDTSTGNVTKFESLYKYRQSNTLDKRRDNRFDAGWIAGAGVEYALKTRYHVFVEGRIQYGFTDQQKKYMTNQVPRYNSSYGVNAGILYQLKKTSEKFTKG